jgi:CO dehydrogenase/acetyl-CoA synthase gamma subunit (corrinoid Fe-S protein)
VTHQIVFRLKNIVALTILERYKVLPKANCGKYGQAACLAFAAKVITDG